MVAARKQEMALAARKRTAKRVSDRGMIFSFVTLVLMGALITAPAISLGNRNLYVIASLQAVYDSDNHRDVTFDPGPTRGQRHSDSYFPPSQILLIAEIWSVAMSASKPLVSASFSNSPS